jgi:trimeric autotransporter adhesin
MRRVCAAVPHLISALAAGGSFTFAGCAGSGDALTGTPGVTVGAGGVDEGGRMVTGEDGRAASFTIALDRELSSSVSIRLASLDPSEGTLDRAELLFDRLDWAAPQTIVVSGVDDDEADGDVAFDVEYVVESVDLTYAQLGSGSVAFTNEDDDSPGFTVSAASGDTIEDGVAASLTVALRSRPTADVTVRLRSGDETEAVVDASALAFTPANWNAAQTITVTGADDDLDDGDVVYRVVFQETLSEDPVYGAIRPTDVELTNLDDDSAAISVIEMDGLTGEDGATGSFTVVLGCEPTAIVLLDVESDDPGEGTVSPQTLVFTPNDWNVARTVTVEGVDDDLDDDIRSYSIVFTTTTDDQAYAAIEPDPVAMSSADDDVAGFSVTAISGDTGEDGTAATFTVALTSEPTGNVTVNLDSSDHDEGTVDLTSLAFTPDDWDVAQTVTVTGVDDALDDGDAVYTIQFSATTGDDPAYTALTPDSFPVTNADND